MRGVVCEIDLPAGVTLETGKQREERGQLEGRAYKPVTPGRRGLDATEDRLKVEWVVRTAPTTSPDTAITLTARHERAGPGRATLTLP